jgi:hypothetical protein
MISYHDSSSLHFQLLATLVSELAATAMVIPPSCPGVNIEVLVHGHPVQEYDDVDRGPVPPNTVTKYIEAPSDTEFAIRLKVTDAFLFPPSDMELGTSIDRDIVVRSLFRSSNLFSAQGCIVEGRACRIGYVSDALQKFRFTPLHVGRSTLDSSSKPTEHMIDDGLTI